MNEKMYFYKCETCEQIVASNEELANPLSCCDKQMSLLIPCISDGAVEKHVPVFSVDGQNVTVTVGSEPHPMTEEHYIEWICLVTDQSVQWQPLSPNDAPSACFRLRKDEKIRNIYEYCNIHGLWVYSTKE